MPDARRGLHEAVEQAMTVGDPYQRRERVHAAIDAHLDALTAAHRKALGWHHRQMMTTARTCSFCWNHRREPHDA